MARTIGILRSRWVTSIGEVFLLGVYVCVEGMRLPRTRHVRNGTADVEMTRGRRPAAAAAPVNALSELLGKLAERIGAGSAGLCVQQILGKVAEVTAIQSPCQYDQMAVRRSNA